MTDRVAAFRIVVDEADEDAAVAALWERGTLGLESRPAGGRVSLLAYFPDEPGLAGSVSAALARLSARVEPAAVPDVDWVARFREGFRTVRAGGFVVAPPWDVPAERGARTLVLDPGRAFGTGTHESTRLCLTALERLAATRPLGRVADVGTGTGILALAAARLGARLVIAADHDPEATAAARAHAGLNEAAVHVVRGDGGRPFAAGAFDLVTANLTAPLLVERAAELAVLLAPRGALVLAGFLVEDLETVSAAFAAVGGAEPLTDGEWAAALVRRNGS